MILDPLLDLFRGKAITIPPMDGAFRPNTALDDAEIALEIQAPDNLVFDGARVLFSTGNEVRALAQAGEFSERVLAFAQPISAMAAGPGRMLAIATQDGSIAIHGGALDGIRFDRNVFGSLACVTALAFEDDHALIVAQGSRLHPPDDWAIDLMEKGQGGSLWRLDLRAGRADCLAQGLAYPNGILVERDRILFSESWRHRLAALPRDGGPIQPLLTNLPGYPSRLSPIPGGGAWLAFFAPRNRLIEFVLREDDYRRDMMREIPRQYWIAPALSSNLSFLEPLQCGGVKTMGIHKPWSPSRSYGLAVRLDAAMRPVASYHSRANGRRHGLTSVVAADDRHLASAKGGNLILDIGGA